MGDEAKVTVDLSPVVTLVQGVRDDVGALRHEVSESVREVRDDVGTLSQKVAEISVDHAQRITRTEDGIETVRDRVSAVETRVGVVERTVSALTVVEAQDGAVQVVRTKRVADWRWRVMAVVGGVGAGAATAAAVFYGVHG